MTDSTENAAPPKSAKSRNSDSSVQIQIKLKPQSEFVPRDIEESEFFDSADFIGVVFSVVIPAINSYLYRKHRYLPLN